MFIKSLDSEDIRHIFKEYMVNDFPEAELKPVNIMEEYLNRGWYKCYGAYEGENLVAYAFFVTGDKSNCLLLDYYAVVGKFRNKGYGGMAIKAITDELTGFDDVFLEVEDIDYAADESDKSIRTRRKAFYLRNGVKDTPLRTLVWGVYYNIMYIPLATSSNKDNIDEEYGDFVIRDIYGKMFDNKFYKKIYEILPNKKVL